jgi:hypothetical protein
MNNPLDASPEFRRELRNANFRNTQKEKILNKTFIRTILNSDTPHKEIGELVTDPSQVDILRTLKSLLGGRGQFRGVDQPAWNRIQEGYLHRLVSNPTSIERILTDVGNDIGLDILLPKGTRRQLLEYGKLVTEFRKSGMYKLLVMQRGQGTRAVAVIRDGSVEDLAKIVTAVGGKTSPGGRSLQAGIIEHLLDTNTRFTKGRHILREASFISDIDEMLKTGKLQVVMEDHVIRNLNDIKAFVSFMPTESGIGEGIQTAGLSSSTAFGEAIRAPRKFLGAQTKLLSNYMQARYLLSETMANIINFNQKHAIATIESRGSYLRLLVGMTATMLKRAEQDAKSLLGTEDLGAYEELATADLGSPPTPISPHQLQLMSEANPQQAPPQPLGGLLGPSIAPNPELFPGGGTSQ